MSHGDQLAEEAPPARNPWGQPVKLGWAVCAVAGDDWVKLVPRTWGWVALAPATPRGVIELLRFHGVPLVGRHAVVLGRSNIVGRPLATMLSQKDCNMTVTLGHSGSGTKLPEIAREADLLVAAIGRPEMITDAWVKPGATVVDVGIHRVPLDAPDANGKKVRLVGDVHAPSVSRVAGALTPVPGGVGPMTVAMVIANTTWAAAQQAAGHLQAR